MEKVKLNLIPLTEENLCSLEVELYESGDMCIGIAGQDTEGEFHRVSAQIPNPINGGGGNLEDYVVLGKIYDILKKSKHKK